MDFDRYTIVLLVTPENPPVLSEEEADRLQNAHLSHLADLHESGVLLAAGPVGDPSGRRRYRGLSIMRCEPDEALRLKGAEILRARGWDIYRIWSTDWYRNRETEVERLRSYLRQKAGIGATAAPERDKKDGQQNRSAQHVAAVAT